MTVEIASFLNDLNDTYPTSGDPRSEGDDHIRLVKSVLKATLPGLAGRVNRVQAKTGDYTAVLTDNASILNFTVAATLSLTPAATIGNGYGFTVLANGVQVILDPAGAETINGSASLTLQSGEAAFVYCAGSSWIAVVDQAVLALASQAEAEAGVENTKFMTALRVAQAIVGAVRTYTKAQRGAVVSLTDAATVALDLSAANNFSLLLTSGVGATRQLGNPTNAVAGQSGVLVVTQDATGSRAISYGSNYKFAGGSAPALSTAANAVDYLSYYVESATRIFISANRDIK